jgi:hypothetical protein
MLFELFGICSGDKRLYELSEAFHLQLLQVSVLIPNVSYITNVDIKISFGWKELISDAESVARQTLVLSPPTNLHHMTDALAEYLETYICLNVIGFFCFNALQTFTRALRLHLIPRRTMSFSE